MRRPYTTTLCDTKGYDNLQKAMEAVKAESGMSDGEFETLLLSVYRHNRNARRAVI